MSILGNELSLYMKQREISLPQLSTLCNIERSTLYQYLKGKRPLRNKEQLDRIINVLHLMPEEIDELMAMYEMEQVGEALYYQRKYIGEFLSELPAISQKLSMEVRKDEGLPEELQENRNVIVGKMEVKQAVYHLMKSAYTTGRNTKIYLPPSCGELVDILEIFRGGVSRCRVVHIVGMEPDCNREIKSNLKQMKNIMRCCNMMPDYNALYYYGRAKERFGSMSILPGIIVTDEAALQISADGKQGIMHTEPELVTFFTEIFKDLESQCVPLMYYQSGAEAVIGFCFDDFKNMIFEDTLELCNGMCSMQFWTEKLVRTYLNHALPEYEKMVEAISQYCVYVYETKRKGHTKVMMNASGILEFIRNGTFREYPDFYFEKPLSIEARRMILNHMLRACSEGWYEFCIVDEKGFPVPGDWEVMVNRRNQLTIQGFVEDECKVFACTETGIVEAVYDYMDYLGKSNIVMSPEQSIEQLKQWMEKYLPHHLPPVERMKETV